MAAVLPAALDLSAVAVDDPSEFDLAIGPLLYAARTERPSNVAQLPRWFHFPDEFAQAWKLLQTKRTPRFIGPMPRRTSDRALTPSQVPCQLLSRLYGDRLQACFGGRMTEQHARTFCSLAILRSAGASSWEDAGEQIGIGRRRARLLANNAVVKLNAARARTEFWREIEPLIAVLAGEQIDYRERERTFASFTRLDATSWQRICAESGVRTGKHGSRERYACAWLWAEITGCDWRHAPALGHAATESQREVYRHFQKGAAPQPAARSRSIRPRTDRDPSPTPSAGGAVVAGVHSPVSAMRDPRHGGTHGAGH